MRKGCNEKDSGAVVKGMDNTETTTTTPETPYSNETERVLIEMLTENTGRALGDSGDHYGRNWQRNQDLAFVTAPAVDITLSDDALYPLHNVYHWLKERLTFDPEMDAKFQAHAKEQGEHTYWIENMETFTEEIEATGIYGEGEPMTVNTYNHECALNQTLQFRYFTLKEPRRPGMRYSSHKSYVILQIHGGCDVRGGYTGPRVFEVLDDISILDFAQAEVYCRDCESGWYTQNGGYHWNSHNGQNDRKAEDFKPLKGDHCVCPECGSHKAYVS